MRRLIVFVLWAVLTLAALVVILGIFATRGDLDRSDLPRIQVGEAVIENASAKLADFVAISDQARARGRAAPAQIAFTHEEVTALMADWGQDGHWFGALDDLQIAFLDGVVVVTGIIESLGQRFPFRIDLEVLVENGERMVELQRVQIGELFAPGFLRTALLELVARTVDAGLPRISLEIESLISHDGEIILSGSAKP